LTRPLFLILAKGLKESKMTSLRAFLLSTVLATGMIGPAHADLSARVVDGLTANGGWVRANAELIAQRLEPGFKLHDSIGGLEDRINALRRLSDKPDAQRLALRHPGYLDALLVDPDGFSDVIGGLALDRAGEEALLSGLSRRPTTAGLQGSLALLRLYGQDLARLAPEPGFLDLFEVLSFIADEPASPELRDWLGRRIHELRPERIGQLTHLLVLHYLPLRDLANSEQLELGWQALASAQSANPELYDVLIQHRGVWGALQTPGFVTAMKVQVRYDQDQARAVLAFLLGTDLALFETSETFNWPKPLDEGYNEAALDIIAVNDPLAMAAMLRFRANPEFWDFAKDRQRRLRIGCLVEKGRNDPDSLRTYFAYETAAVEKTCKPEHSLLVRNIPLFSIYVVAENYRAGVPLGWGNALLVTVDVASIIPIGRVVGYASKVAVKGLPTVVKGARLATNETASQAVLAVVQSSIRAEVSNRAREGMGSGLGLAFGIKAVAVLLHMSANPKLSSAVMAALREYGQNIATEEALTSAISTEFFRCAALSAQRIGVEEICKGLMPAMTAEAEKTSRQEEPTP